MKSSKIKIIIFIVIVLFAHILNANAQGYEFGIRLNPEFTGLLNKNDMNAGNSLKLTSNFAYLSFGAGVVYNINNNIGLAVDLLFSREGQRFSGKFTGNTLDKSTYSSVVNTQALLNNVVIVGDYVAKAELNYIKLPFMLSLSTDKTKTLFATLLVGPQINFLVNVAQEINHNDLDYPNTNIKPMNLYKAVTVNGVMALGGAYNLSSKIILSAKFRFDYGFNDVEKKNAMVSYAGAIPVRFYSAERTITRNITGGLLIGLDFKL